MRKSTPLTMTNPELAGQWHPTKNGALGPEDVSAGSNKKVWWQCAHGHEWEAVISSRVRGGGCPYCSGRKPVVGVNDLATTHPELAEQWDASRNGGLGPQDVTSRSARKVWWTCDCGHSWQAPVRRRTDGSGCPYCLNQKVLVGFNDLATLNPALAAEWHPVKNGRLTPKDVVPGSNKKAWWQCAHGHEWEAVISSRARGIGCPYCSGRKPVVGVNDLATTHPELAAEWDREKNGETIPRDVKAGSSNRKYWWVCPEGHSYQATVANRTSNGQGCPYCSGARVIPGETDLAAVNPALAAEWHPAKNGDLGPGDVSAKSNRKVWWRHWDAESGMWHEWQETVGNRAAGNGCPYCSNHRLLAGYNDLESRFPEVAAEWHPTKNGDLKPSQVVYSSRTPVWWKCALGHEWRVSPASRTTKGKTTGCPRCSGGHGTSFPEQAIAYYLHAALGCEVLSREKVEHGGASKEADVLVPSLMAAIEYNGEWWHSGREEKDAEKAAFFEDLGYRFIVVLEGDGASATQNTIAYNARSGKLKDLDAAIESLLAMLGAQGKASVDCARDQVKILARYKREKAGNSLARRRPDLAAEWDWGRNHGLSPESFSAMSSREVWWRCPACGRSYRSPVQRRAVGGGCPYCGRKVVSKGANDLASVHPDLLEWWDYELNEVLPDEVFAGSSKSRWWRSPEGGEPFLSTPERMAKGKPKLIVGLTDLATKRPDLCLEWDQEKNGGKRACDVTAGSHYKAWWKCHSCGWSWRSTVSSRTQGQGNCPHCGSLAVLRPDLLEEWDYGRNAGVDPNTVSAHSGKKAWWRHVHAESGTVHEWAANISDRVSGRGCPYCSNRKVLAGFNDLATLNPALAAEWHPTKNGALTPSDVTPGSNKKAWWKGGCGHEWEAVIASRNSGCGCPVCRARKSAAARARPVLCVETGEIWPSIAQAQKETGISNISACAAGRKRTAGGFHWRYAESPACGASRASGKRP